MKRYIGILLAIFFILKLYVAAGPNDCGVYLSTSADNVLSGQNFVVMWTTPGGATDAVLKREFWDKDSYVSSQETLTDISLAGHKNFVGNEQGYTERYTLDITYYDGTTSTTTCVVTINSAHSLHPQVLNFSINGRDATLPGSSHHVFWETRNVNQVHLLGRDPDQQQVFLKSNLAANGSVSFTIPSDYAYPTLHLVLMLDDLSADELPSAAFWDLPISFSTNESSPSVPVTTWNSVRGATSQTFENGIMLWLPDFISPAVVIMYDDGTWVAGNWENKPNMSFNKIPPAGHYIPVAAHAFGKVWIQNPEIREKLGWAVSQETGIAISVRYSDDFLFVQMPDGEIRRMNLENQDWLSD